jgi:hypothetical protein
VCLPSDCDYAASHSGNRRKYGTLLYIHGKIILIPVRHFVEYSNDVRRHLSLSLSFYRFILLAQKMTIQFLIIGIMIRESKKRQVWRRWEDEARQG